MKKQIMFAYVLAAFAGLSACTNVAPKEEPKDIVAMFHQSGYVVVELVDQNAVDSLEKRDDMLIYCQKDSITDLRQKLDKVYENYLYSDQTEKTKSGRDYTAFFRPTFDGVAITSWELVRFGDEAFAEALPAFLDKFNFDCEVYYDHEVDTNETLKERVKQVLTKAIEKYEAASDPLLNPRHI